MGEGSSVPARDRARARPWLVVGLAGWLTVGVLLVDRAIRQGLIDDVTASPYHLVGYAGLAALGLYVGWRLLGGMRRRRWRESLPPHYGGLGVGFALIVAWIVVDPLWQATLGIGFGFENAIAPPRLLVPLALALVASGPVREALANRSTGLAAVPAVLGLGLIGACATLVGLNPVRDPMNDYVRNQGIDLSEIWLMATDGSQQQRLLGTHGEGVDYSLPAWSPDGRRIAYTTWTNAPGLRQNWLHREQTAAIWTMAADGSDRRMVADGAPNQAWIPAWSPDGQWIAYVVSPTNEVPSTAAEPVPNAAPGALGPAVRVAGARTWLVRPDGTDAHELDGPVGVTGAAWSPDGSTLAYVREVGGQSDVFVATFRDGAVADDERALASDPAAEWGIAWSPDGKRIAFNSERTSNPDVWVVDVDGDGLRQLTDDPAGDWTPAWSPDGSTIAFVSERSGDSEVWSMAADGSEAANLSRDPGAIDGQWSVAFAPDGSRLAYARASFQPEWASGFARWELMAAEYILLGIVLTLIGLVLVALRAPLGSFAVVLAVMTFLAAFSTDEWRFVPGAIIAGAVVDLAHRIGSRSSRARLAAVAFPSLAVLAFGVTIGLGNALSWSLTMLLGVSAATALIGWAIEGLVSRLGPTLAVER